MTKPHSVEQLFLFAIHNQSAEHELDRVEERYGVDLQRGHAKSLASDEDYYPQIEGAIRAEASMMAPYYEIFYSLEKTIRGLVRDVLEESEGEGWWSSPRVPDNIRKVCDKRMKREVDTGVTIRSTDPLDFSTFGELGELMTENWDLFGGQFTSKSAITRVYE